MVRPVTNCLPSKRIARSTPFRISGSPPLRRSEVTAASSAESLRESTSWPLTSNPHAAALTNSDGLLPTCARQSPRPILSRINRSRVAGSGMRNSASARHISATPSRESSENSSISASTPPAVLRAARTPCASDAARRWVAASACGVNAASSNSAWTAAASSMRYAAAIRAGSTEAVPSDAANTKAAELMARDGNETSSNLLFTSQ